MHPNSTKNADKFPTVSNRGNDEDRVQHELALAESAAEPAAAASTTPCSSPGVPVEAAPGQGNHEQTPDSCKEHLLLHPNGTKNADKFPPVSNRGHDEDRIQLELALAESAAEAAMEMGHATVMLHSFAAGNRPRAPGHLEEALEWSFEMEHGSYTAHMLTKAFQASNLHVWEEPHYPSPSETSLSQ